jgi:hypothetical protein
LPGWPYRLTEGQLRLLRTYGCVFDAYDQQAAWRMRYRGFNVAQYVQAWSDLSAVARGKRQYLETVATFRLLGVKWGKFREFTESGKSLTNWYNVEVIGGRGRAIWGWVLVGIFTPALIAGAALLAVTEKKVDDDSATSALKIVGRTFGGMMTGGGALGVALGLWLGISGEKKKERWYKGRFLEDGSAPQIQRSLKRRSQVNKPTHYYASPVFTRGGGGLVFGFQW